MSHKWSHAILVLTSEALRIFEAIAEVRTEMYWNAVADIHSWTASIFRLIGV
jgi:hypothetical protein